LIVIEALVRTQRQLDPAVGAPGVGGRAFLRRLTERLSREAEESDRVPSCNAGWIEPLGDGCS
jgi:hypothetical protein